MTAQDAPSFSLVTEPWIACRAPDGAPVLLSLRDVFDGAHPVAEVRGDSPTQDYAVLRVLITIFFRAHGRTIDLSPTSTFEYAQWLESVWDPIDAGRADEPVLDYLEEHRDRLDLLHPTTPFMQVADLRTEKGTRSGVSRIIPEAENDYFTMRTGEARASLSYAEAARWLIHTQAYDYSGIKSGAVGDPRVKGGKGYPIGQGWTGLTGGTTVLGGSLRETLVLNTVPSALLAGDADLPAWEREPDGPAPRASSEPTGAADLMTWQSRRVRLFAEDGRVRGVLVCNGDAIPEAGANVFGDPMTPYRFSTNKSTKVKQVFYPRPYETDRMMWRSLEPLLCLDGDHPDTGSRALPRGAAPPRRPQVLDLVAQVHRGKYADESRAIDVRLTSTSYGPQASSASTSVDARIGFPRALLHRENRLARVGVLENARASLDAGIALGRFAGELLQAAGGDYVFQPGPTDAVLGDLEPAFREWLRDLRPEQLDSATSRWQTDLRRTILERARQMLRGAGSAALIGREHVVNDRLVVHSAGTAYANLQRQLTKILPAADGPSAPPGPADPATAPSPDPTKELTDV